MLLAEGKASPAHGTKSTSGQGIVVAKSPSRILLNHAGSLDGWGKYQVQWQKKNISSSGILLMCSCCQFFLTCLMLSVGFLFDLGGRWIYLGCLLLLVWESGNAKVSKVFFCWVGNCKKPCAMLGWFFFCPLLGFLTYMPSFFHLSEFVFGCLLPRVYRYT